MSSKHLEQAIATLSAQVTQQNVQIAELQKQLTDMQAAMSCELEASKSTIFSIQAAIENNEKAFNENLRELQSRFTVSNHGDAHFKGVIISK
ncbi:MULTISPECIES: hypothetical protein [Providencia]|uniref:hypothetical protein n=1 Tax=Providencia TaxID=586 RepID=UPI00234B490B|nr:MULTISPECIES: hypothetical protein [Providencia]MDN0012535.1 hypothetical protein [Providencia stuartii]